MKQKPPDNERRVLTWARDSEGNEDWDIDRYVGGDWIEAKVWNLKVLWWQELPPRRDLEGE